MNFLSIFLNTLSALERVLALSVSLREPGKLWLSPVAALTVHRTVIHSRDCASLNPKGGAKGVF